MSRSAERATPILLSSCSSLPLREMVASSWRITRREWMVSRALVSRSLRRPGRTGPATASSRKENRWSTSSA